MATYRERYLAGEHTRVWAELVALGPEVRREPVFADALAVARETMRRARHNIEHLIPRLRALGYAFGYDWAVEAEWAAPLLEANPPLLGQPDAQTPERIARLEAEMGPLPLSLRAFYEIVGAVNFVGAAPTDVVWSEELDLDPLFVYGLDWTEELWQEIHDGSRRRQDFQLQIAPDFLLKYLVGGVGAIGIVAPSPNADAPLTFDGGVLSSGGKPYLFIEYLRTAFRFAGFPGLEDHPDAVMPELPDLVAGLLPL